VHGYPTTRTQYNTTSSSTMVWYWMSQQAQGNICICKASSWHSSSTRMEEAT
jgi:hypothetical protein